MLKVSAVIFACKIFIKRDLSCLQQS